MQRCKSNASIPLPTLSILRMLYDSEKEELIVVSAFTKNFCVAFLEISLPRVQNNEDNSLVLPCLMNLIDSTSPTVSLSAQVVHILLSYLMAGSSQHGSVPESACKYVAKTDDTSNLFNFFVDLLVYRPPQTLSSLSQGPPPPASPNPPSPSTPPAPTTAFGMTQAGTSRLLSRHAEHFRSEKKLASLKLLIINLVSPSRGGLYRLPR